jgi:hypothetical protein
VRHSAPRVPTIEPSPHATSPICPLPASLAALRRESGYPAERDSIDRGLKHLADDDTRSVPIPPELVMIMREHIEEFGTAADGRLFRTATGGMIYDHTATWAAARTFALTPEQGRLTDGGPTLLPGPKKTPRP